MTDGKEMSSHVWLQSRPAVAAVQYSGVWRYTFGSVKVIGHYADEEIDYDYRQLEVRARQLASAL
jgi:hypothetical protein